MYRANMHITPLKVRARVCELLEKGHKELIHLSYKAMNGDYDTLFVLVAKAEDSEECSSIFNYSVHCFNSETDKFFRTVHSLTYADALIKMGEIIKE